MRNNVYSDTFWYGDMFLPVWAKNEICSKFHIQYIWKIVRGWHHQLAHLNIHKDWSRSVFRKKIEISKCHIFLISHPIFIIFSLFCRKKMYSFFWFNFGVDFPFNRVLWVLKALRIVLAEAINIFRKLLKTNILRDAQGWTFYHRFMYIAPSSGHSLLNCNLPFKLILRRVEVVFWCLEWKCCPFKKIDEISFKPTNTILWLYCTAWRGSGKAMHHGPGKSDVKHLLYYNCIGKLRFLKECI